MIFEVRDPATGDSGAIDKRRLIIESEFAQILKVLAREGNTLSPVVRNAWDGKPLQTIAKNAPVGATAAHIAIIGHITKDELLRFVSGTLTVLEEAGRLTRTSSADGRGRPAEIWQPRAA